MAARSPSLWVLIAAAIATAIMVHPSFAALLTLPIQLGLLVVLRWTARREGRLEERSLHPSTKRGFV
ncbi:hypothetical protein ABID82_007313 [Methylobacterium sp. PvP062]|uniref:Uncharacterized protein n=1 Tax=Methylobacterium radiotolerans TaxID=31998 RepID=A0ABV2NP62_9HYPH|nr:MULTISPECIES: hypothetical protein [unclassified Methylobacterium]MBP2494672.1 hypothetical protein [Methylobacterium sp. PvP105]MBP2494978.1 hypothetical protein [Methylobacterium sp. PvP105]MBP2505151.1 hypothetical protein [Methylobacterium sp. PvP109]MBP2505457.1 hypothetical protein [Methylobacterium sp. PvP109]